MDMCIYYFKSLTEYLSYSAVAVFKYIYTIPFICIRVPTYTFYIIKSP